MKRSSSRKSVRLETSASAGSNSNSNSRSGSPVNQSPAPSPARTASNSSTGNSGNPFAGIPANYTMAATIALALQRMGNVPRPGTPAYSQAVSQLTKAYLKTQYDNLHKLGDSQQGSSSQESAESAGNGKQVMSIGKRPKSPVPTVSTNSSLTRSNSRLSQGNSPSTPNVPSAFPLPHTLAPGSNPNVSGTGRPLATPSTLFPNPSRPTTESAMLSQAVYTKETFRSLMGQVDPDGKLDADVEDILSDLTDTFIREMVEGGILLAKHRHSDSLDIEDLQLYLERNYNLRIPGFADTNSDGIKRKRILPKDHAARAVHVRDCLRKASAMADKKDAKRRR